MANRLLKLAILAMLCAVGACNGLPRDPNHTLERVQKDHRLRVGLSEHPPWVLRTTGEPQGIEVELARRFASSLGANPEWHWGTENQHMRALKNFDLELAVCGLDSDTPWSKEVGLTRPSFRSKHVMAAPPGENGFIVRLEAFLASQKAETERMVSSQP
jgi:polar amino acid transport system substrate-binding protein